jgi:hypothetical protein
MMVREREKKIGSRGIRVKKKESSKKATNNPLALVIGLYYPPIHSKKAGI